MALDLSSAKFIGPALPDPFVKFDLEKILNQNNLLAKTTGEEGKKLQEIWDIYRRKIRDIGINSGAIRVKNHIIDPLINLFEYASLEESEKVKTREGDEDSGFFLKTIDNKSKIRVWTISSGTDLEAPIKRGYAYRFSIVRIAQRVLLTTQERIGILTDGIEIRILISDSARPDSQVVINIDPDWKNSREVPDTFRFLLAITSPKGIQILPEIIDKARLKQSTITKELRVQARQALECLIQGIIDVPANKMVLDTYSGNTVLAKELWYEGLIIVYRLLFILKGEASDDPAKSFGFTGSSIWRNTYSPTVKLADFVRKSMDEGADTGNLLGQGLRIIFKMFEKGVKSTELNITPLGGALFGENSTPLLSKLHWPEKACAKFLDKLLWTLSERRGGQQSRQRIHYGALDIGDLGRVYEALLELEPGIAEEKMCRLRRSKLEVVVPYAQGEKYKESTSSEEDEIEEEEETDEEESRGSTNIKWIEEIKKGQFYLRVGLGRKSTGSYYTPHSFVRFLVQETLGPKIEKCSPKSNPFPNNILKIKVLDPAMGSGHFLVEACRFMADKLYEACRLCDEKALESERKIEKETDLPKKRQIKEQADAWRNRIIEIPDPNDEILKYLPSSAPEGRESGLSQKKAEALCKRLIAVHCLYGVDKNKLAVELAKLSLWLESQSEGFPLTFLDHRLVVGDSITGPFFEHLLKSPGTQQPVDDIFYKGLEKILTEKLKEALVEIKEIERSVGIDLTDIESKKHAKERLENCLLPFKVLAASWTGSVMFGVEETDDTAYLDLAKTIAETGALPRSIQSNKLLKAIAKGFGIEENLTLSEIVNRIKEGKTISALPYDLTFPEVFFELTETGFNRKGFDVALGNPPWDRIEVSEEEYWGCLNLDLLNLPDKEARQPIIIELKTNYKVAGKHWDYLIRAMEQLLQLIGVVYSYQSAKVQGMLTTGRPYLYRVFAERAYQLLSIRGNVGLLLPSAFHANEGATGVRQLYLKEMALKYCYSFENRKKLFEIDSRFKFALIVAQKNTSGTNEFKCGYYMHHDGLLFDSTWKPLRYTPEKIKSITGDLMPFPECRSQVDFDVLSLMQSDGTISLNSHLENLRISFTFGVELHRNSEFNITLRKFVWGDEWKIPGKVSLDWTVFIYEGKCFYQFQDRGEFEIKKCTTYAVCLNKDKWNPGIAFFRIAFRAVAASTNERTLIATLLRPGSICNHTCGIEVTPHKRKNSDALILLACLNSFLYDWHIRQRVGSNIGAYQFGGLRFTKNKSIYAEALLLHSAIRLSCNHEGFVSLWHEQLGNNWREPNKKPFTWPVLATDSERWQVRSAIDAVVADAYGLNREQYEHILKSFDRASGSNPYTDICLAKFDELKKIGLDAFTKKYDPYWDIPLNENLPKPVIDLPIPQEEGEKDIFGNVIVAKAPGRRRKR